MHVSPWNHHTEHICPSEHVKTCRLRMFEELWDFFIDGYRMHWLSVTNCISYGYRLLKCSVGWLFYVVVWLWMVIWCCTWSFCLMKYYTRLGDNRTRLWFVALEKFASRLCTPRLMNLLGRRQPLSLWLTNGCKLLSVPGWRKGTSEHSEPCARGVLPCCDHDNFAERLWLFPKWHPVHYGMYTVLLPASAYAPCRNHMCVSFLYWIVNKTSVEHIAKILHIVAPKLDFPNSWCVDLGLRALIWAWEVNSYTSRWFNNRFVGFANKVARKMKW